MALFGELKITTSETSYMVIGYWSARRLEQPRGDINTYEVVVEYQDTMGKIHKVQGQISHEYGDGALVLASEVLAWAASEISSSDISETTEN